MPDEETCLDAGAGPCLSRSGYLLLIFTMRRR